MTVPKLPVLLVSGEGHGKAIGRMNLGFPSSFSDLFCLPSGRSGNPIGCRDPRAGTAR